jgi:chromate transporter
VFLVASKLGISSFGGPVAHLGYFRREYVQRRKWLDDETFADLVALCQSLPGPASTETGIAIGLLRAGVPGPLFTFASYLGAALQPVPAAGDLFAVWPPHGPLGAVLATCAIFLPAFLLVFAALPSWGTLRSRAWARGALRGVNAAVVGLLFAALVDIARAIASTLR